MIFANTDKEITLIYNSEENIGRKILAYAYIENLPVRDIDLKHIKLTSTHWAELAYRMKVNVRDLVNTEHPNFSQKFGRLDQLSDEDWLNLLIHNPAILKAAIVMKGDKVIMMCNPQEMLCFVKYI
ncbi:MAG: arsenate reductase [Ulvibacter sp.]|jgi:arsenate reductase